MDFPLNPSLGTTSEELDRIQLKRLTSGLNGALGNEVAFLDPSELSEWTSFQGPLVLLPTLVVQLTVRPSG